MKYLPAIGVIATVAIFLAISMANADTVTIVQDGETFRPKDVTINVGDTVQWIWTGGNHTVTEGKDGKVDGAEAFHATLGAANPTYAVLFDERFVVANFRADNRFEYCSIPGFPRKMTGSITVAMANPTVKLEINGQHPNPAVVYSDGPVKMSISMEPGQAGSEPLAWLLAIIIPKPSGEVVVLWAVPGGLSETPAPLAIKPPLKMTKKVVLDTTFPPGTTMMFFFALADEGDIKASDIISVIVGGGEGGGEGGVPENLKPPLP